MPAETIAIQVREFIISNYLFDDAASMPSDDASLLEKGIIDSMGVLDLILFVEETFGIAIADEDVLPENLDSVHHIVRYIKSQVSAVAA